MNEAGTQILVETIVWVKGYLEGLGMIIAVPELSKLKKKIDEAYERLTDVNFPGVIYYQPPSKKEDEKI